MFNKNSHLLCLKHDEKGLPIYGTLVDADGVESANNNSKRKNATNIFIPKLKYIS